MDFLNTLCAKCTDDSLMLDIGANVGGYTNLLLQQKGIIHAFEPCPKLADDIQERFKNESRVMIISVALSDRQHCEKEMTVFNAWTLGKANEPNKRHVSPGAVDLVGKDPFEVCFISLDWYMKKIGQRQIDFIKIDVDGYELRVLKGARETIMRYRPNILIELSGMVDDIGDSIEEFVRFIHETLGYRLHDQNGDVMPYSNWRAWYPFNTSEDFAMVPQESILVVR